jgi:hypothetical protein
MHDTHDVARDQAERAAGAAQYLEEQKVALDFIKHLTTLATGTVVLLATFLKDLFKRPEWPWLVPLAFACSWSRQSRLASRPWASSIASVTQARSLSAFAP